MLPQRNVRRRHPNAAPWLRAVATEGDSGSFYFYEFCAPRLPDSWIGETAGHLLGIHTVVVRGLGTSSALPVINAGGSFTHPGLS